MWHAWGGQRCLYRVLAGRPEGKIPRGRPRRRWEDNIKIDLRETGIDGIMEMNDQLHTPATLPSRKMPPVSIV
jgi:hypothetical protein